MTLLIYTIKWKQYLNDIEYNSLVIIPPTIQLNLTETYKLAKKQSNLAMQYWERWNRSMWQNDLLEKFKLKYCEDISLTHPLLLNHHNVYWQITSFKISPSNEIIDMFLYNAYYDLRPSSGPAVVLLTVNTKDDLTRLINWS